LPIAYFIAVVYPEFFGTFSVNRHNRFHIAGSSGPLVMARKLIVTCGVHAAARFVALD
jgi:hypothetical protein